MNPNPFCQIIIIIFFKYLCLDINTAGHCLTVMLFDLLTVHVNVIAEMTFSMVIVNECTCT